MKDIELFNGDCLEIMPKLIEQGIKVDAVITDIPYGTTECCWDEIIPFKEMWKNLNKLVKDDGAICLFGAEPFSTKLRMSNFKNFKYDWIWEKSKSTGYLNSRKQPLRKYEIISVFYKKQPTFNLQNIKKIDKPFIRKGTTSKGKISSGNLYGKAGKDSLTEYKNYPCNILKFKSVMGNIIHPTQKPVDLLEYLVKTYTNENEIVLDFTMGSGTTALACKHWNRRFIGIELNKKYFDIAEQRVEEELI